MGEKHPPPSPHGKRLTHDTTMTLWHASTELRLTVAAAIVAKTVYTAAGLMGLAVCGLCLTGAELDTSG